MFEKLFDKLIELVSGLFGWILGGSFLIILLIFPLSITYLIWSGMFSLLPDRDYLFIILVIPALIGSVLAISWVGDTLGIVDLYGDVDTSAKTGKKVKTTKKFLCATFFIAVLIAEIGLAYLYPAPFIDDRGYRGGNGNSSGYGSSDTTNHFNDNETRIHKWHWFAKSDIDWDHFEKNNRIGDTYGSITRDYPNMTDSGNSGGGVLLQASEELYFAFPALDKSQISNADLCTGMTGTMKELFGYGKSTTVNEFKQGLGLTSESEYDGNLAFKKTAPSGYYYVVILSVDIIEDQDPITQDTWISVIKRNREIIPTGRLASEQEATEETVYYVEEGERYHQKSTCPALHDSDMVFECYIDEVPEGRTPCEVCY